MSNNFNSFVDTDPNFYENNTTTSPRTSTPPLQQQQPNPPNVSTFLSSTPFLTPATNASISGTPHSAPFLPSVPISPTTLAYLLRDGVLPTRLLIDFDEAKWIVGGNSEGSAAKIERMSKLTGADISVDDSVNGVPLATPSDRVVTICGSSIAKRDAIALVICELESKHASSFGLTTGQIQPVFTPGQGLTYENSTSQLSYMDTFHGYPLRLLIPAELFGIIMGKGGKQIRQVTMTTGANVQKTIAYTVGATTSHSCVIKDIDAALGIYRTPQSLEVTANANNNAQQNNATNNTHSTTANLVVSQTFRILEVSGTQNQRVSAVNLLVSILDKRVQEEALKATSIVGNSSSSIENTNANITSTSTTPLPTPPGLKAFGTTTPKLNNSEYDEFNALLASEQNTSRSRSNKQQNYFGNKSQNNTSYRMQILLSATSLNALLGPLRKGELLNSIGKRSGCEISLGRCAEPVLQLSGSPTSNSLAFFLIQEALVDIESAYQNGSQSHPFKAQNGIRQVVPNKESLNMSQSLSTYSQHSTPPLVDSMSTHANSAHNAYDTASEEGGEYGHNSAFTDETLVQGILELINSGQD